MANLAEKDLSKCANCDRSFANNETFRLALTNIPLCMLCYGMLNVSSGSQPMTLEQTVSEMERQFGGIDDNYIGMYRSISGHLARSVLFHLYKYKEKA